MGDKRKLTIKADLAVKVKDLYSTKVDASKIMHRYICISMDISTSVRLSTNNHPIRNPYSAELEKSIKITSAVIEIYLCLFAQAQSYNRLRGLLFRSLVRPPAR